MALKTTQPIEGYHEITGTPSLEGLVFTQGSKDYLILPKAVAYCNERNSILQSAREAVGFRCEANGADGANRYQATRTAAVSFVADGKHYIAFDDDVDPKKNIILVRAQEGYDATMQHGCFLLPMSDTHIKQILKRAEKTERIAAVPEQNNWPVAQDNGTSVYGSQHAIRAVLCDMAEPHATFLSRKGYEDGYLLTPDAPRDGKADVRGVGLGGDSYDDVNDVDADRRFYYFGRARGVRGAK